MNKRWTAYSRSMDSLNLMIEEFQLPEIIIRAMINRGIDTVPKAREFFNTSLGSLHDPYLLKGMEQAADRIFKAVRSNEKICIYGDYDVDGI
ncbi:MAG TPA: single-stranded-DNA-specific exonuclease RecJ, partial [Bacillota bacterium]|nr:single-stranded-DNA-specific exonuclease RecJ [Bacillota bacterium]